MCRKIFSQNFPFQTNSNFVRIFFLFGQPLPIFVVLIFSKESRFQRSLLFFSPRLNIFLIPSWAKWHGWKISERFLILRIKSRSTMIVKNWSNKKFSRFCRGQNFVLFTSQTWRDNSNIFKQVFFRTMSAYRWRDFTTEKRKKKYQIIIKK